MTFIAPGSANADGEGGRIVTNCTVFDRRKVYEIVTHAVLDEVQSVHGTGEVERTGRTVGEQRVYHVIATSKALARAMYETEWRDRFRAPHTLISITALFVIDAEIVASRN